MIERQTATVYKGHSRRFFTLKAAANDCAKHLILKSLCDCDYNGRDEPPYMCYFHRHEDNAEQYSIIKEAVAGEILNRYKCGITADLTPKGVNIIIKLLSKQHPSLEYLTF